MIGLNPYYHPLFLHFIVYFNDNQDYFECHEVLEEYWKMQDRLTKDHPLTAFILLSTGMYHWRRGNTAGAEKTLNNALLRFRQVSSRFDIYLEEVDIENLLLTVRDTLRKIRTGSEFQAFKLPLSPQLAEAAEQQKPGMVLLPKNSEAVIHKHMLRDRSDILKQREEKKKGSSY